MNYGAKRWSGLMVLCPVLVALTLTVAPLGARASDGNLNPRILPPSSTAFGKTYSAWSSAWWQYVESQPASSNPLVEPTGAVCAVGQSGPVFFLVGTNVSGAATRDKCTVPPGKSLFFPLLNACDVHVACTPATASVCDSNNSPQQVWNDLQITTGFGPFSELHASIDGVPVKNLD